MGHRGITTRGLWVVVMIALALFAGGVVAAVMLRTASGMDLCNFFYDLVEPINNILSGLPLQDNFQVPCPF